MHGVQFHIGGLAVPTHDFFVGLGVAVAALVFLREARSREQLSFQTLVAVTGALVAAARSGCDCRACSRTWTRRSIPP